MWHTSCLHALTSHHAVKKERKDYYYQCPILQIQLGYIAIIVCGHIRVDLNRSVTMLVRFCVITFILVLDQVILLSYFYLLYLSLYIHYDLVLRNVSRCVILLWGGGLLVYFHSCCTVFCGCRSKSVQRQSATRSWWVGSLGPTLRSIPP